MPIDSPPQSESYTKVPLVTRVYYGVLIPATLETWGTYQFDMYKTRVMLDKQHVKPRSSMVAILKSLRHPLTTLPTINTESHNLFQRVLQTNVIGKKNLEFDFTTFKGRFAAARWAHRGITDYWAYKFINRGLKFFGQPLLMEKMMGLNSYHEMAATLSHKTAKICAATSAGMLLGIVEVSANYWDRRKIIAQQNEITKADAIAITVKEGLRAQYRGAIETMQRNVIGSGNLYLFKYLVYAALGVTDHNNPTFWQSFFSSLCGNSASIIASQPSDLLKVRKQMSMDVASIANQSSYKRLKHIYQHEGWHGLTKGVVPKLVSSGFKGTVVMTFSEMLVKKHLHDRKELVEKNNKQFRL